MPYIIAKMRLSPGVGAVVMLNPDVLAPIFGVRDESGNFDHAFVARGIEKLCAPDPRTKNGHESEGRRLVQLSGHLYLVVNGEAYIAIRSRERHADAQARYRNRKQPRKGKSPAQVRAENDGRAERFEEAVRNGDEESADRIAAEDLPGTIPVHGQKPSPFIVTRSPGGKSV